MRTAPIRRTARAVQLAACVALCTATPAIVTVGADATTGSARSRSVEAIDGRLLEITYPDRLDDEMKRWAHRQVEGGGPELERLTRLLRGLLGEEGLRIRYSPEYTGTAAEVFANREANCLSFTHLFVSMAREVGLAAYYVSVNELESYRKSGNLVVISNHITAGFGPPHERTILDFTVRPDVDYHTAKPIADATAYALYHSNRGAEQMQAGDLVAAAEAFYVAIGLDPELPQAWSNLGVVRRRQGDHDAANAAYRRAIDADPEYLPVYQNLLALYQLQQREGVAEELIRLLDRRGNRNPYSYLALGDLSLREERYDEARVFFRRARKRARSDAEPLAALGQLALAVGDEEEARQWLARAQKKDADHPRARRLASALDETKPEGEPDPAAAASP